MFTHFYHSSVRKLVIAFGSLFNDIHISRKNPDGSEKERIRIPLSYGPKEKFLRRLNERSSLDGSANVEVTLPMMGFEITSITYDPSRKRNTLSKKTQRSQTSPEQIKYSYAEVPYNFDFTLSILVRNMDDGLQIVEQILPYFTPEFNVSMNFNDTNHDFVCRLQTSQKTHKQQIPKVTSGATLAGGTQTAKK